MNVNEPDEVLDSVEVAYSMLKEDEPIDVDAIERWQWGEPNIMLVWEEDNRLQKNINTYIADNDSELWFETNVSLDEISNDTVTRYWDNEFDIPTVSFDNTPQDEDVLENVRIAYEKSQSWHDKDDLHGEPRELNLTPKEFKEINNI